MTEVSIREAGKEDVSEIARLWARLDRFHRRLGLAFPAPEQGPTAWVESFERTLGRFSFLWLGEKDGRTQAFLLARIKRAPASLGGVLVGEISDLWVEEEVRGGKVGERLVQQAIDRLEGLGVHSIEVQVLARNEQGFGFWRRQGFDDELVQMRRLVDRR